MNRQRFLLVFALFFLCLNYSHANSIKEFDTDNDRLISAKEYGRFLQATKTKPLGLYDLDSNGSLSANELEVANKALLKSLSEIDECNEIFANENSSGKVALSEFTDPCPILKRSKNSKFGLMLRGDVDGIDLFKSSTSLRKAKAAEIAVAKNEKSDSEVLRLKGALLRPFYLNKGKRSIVVPSLEFNQVRNEPDDSGDVDVLNFSLNTHWELSNFITRIAYFRAGAFYNTDTDFDRDIRGVNSSFEPISIQHGLGAINSFAGSDYRWSLQALGEYGEVFDAGDDPELMDGDEFLRLGGKLSLEVWPFGLEKIKADFEYFYLDAISGDTRDRKYGSAKLIYSLDSTGVYTVSAGYIDGDKTVALEDEEAWSLGFGMKF